MNNPSFSICIPNYNYSHYIGETIKSVLAQTYRNFEIIVVDNASTDNSVQVIKSFQDSRIKLYVNEYNVGFAPNLDRAASKAENDFIIMLSSDDLMKPNALGEYVSVIQTLQESASNALIVSSVEIIDKNGKITGHLHRPDYYQLASESEQMGFTNLENVDFFSGLKVFKEVYPRMSVPGHFCSTAYSKILYNKIGGYSSLNILGPDAHLAYKALLQNTVVAFIRTPLFSYRVHQQNQYNQNRKVASIRLPIDRYLFSIQYSDEELSKAGVNRREMAEFLINDSCMKGAFHELRAGSWLQAFRYWAFAWSAYPALTWSNYRTHFILLLLLTGPFSGLITRLVYRLHRWR